MTAGLAAAVTGGRRPLAERAAEQLRRLVFDGTLAPGDRLGEVALAARLGVSRTPLREAFKILAREGLLVLEPHRGARVAPLDLAELEHTVEVMAALERLVGGLAATRIGEDELAHLRRRHLAMRQAFEAADLDRYFAANQAIHLGLVAACRNPVLEEQYRTLNARILRYRYAANLSPARWAEAMAEHEDILAALEARDGERLGERLARHLEHKLRPLRERLLPSGPLVTPKEVPADSVEVSAGETAVMQPPFDGRQPVRTTVAFQDLQGTRVQRTDQVHAVPIPVHSGRQAVQRNQHPVSDRHLRTKPAGGAHDGDRPSRILSAYNSRYIYLDESVTRLPHRPQHQGILIAAQHQVPGVSRPCRPRVEDESPEQEEKQHDPVTAHRFHLQNLSVLLSRCY